MAQFYKDKHQMMDGAILLYRTTKQKSSMWYMRLKFPSDLHKGYIVRSTGRQGFAEAASYAEKRYRELWNDLHNGVELMTTRSFKALFEEYMLIQRTDVGLYLSKHSISNFAYFGRYWCEYFGSKDVRTLKTADFDKYYSWRRSYWSDGPGSLRADKPANTADVLSDTTLKMDRRRMNQFLEFLLSRNLISNKPKIRTFRKDTSSRRSVGNRDHFTPDEWFILKTKLPQYAYASDSVALGPYHHYSRVMTYLFVMVSANLGTRPGETNKIRWDDISGWGHGEGLKGDRIEVSIPASRKNGAYTAVGMFSLQKYLREIVELHIKTFGDKPSSDDYVFKSYQGKLYNFPTKTFKKLLREWGLYQDTEGRTRTLYSLRGLFISNLLQTGTMSIHDVAKVCGTSVHQIEKHYDRTAPNVPSVALRPPKAP